MNFIINHPYLYEFLVLFIVGLIFSTQLFKYLDDAEIYSINHHQNNLDAVRFFLAGLVIFIHIILIIGIIIKNDYNYYRKLFYPTDFLSMLGVSVFFMISGFLFWKKVSENENFNPISLYKNRFFRIAPLSIFNTIVIIFLVLAFYTKFSFSAFNADLLNWFTFGLVNNRLDINGFPNTNMLLAANVQWTLVYEWGFYFSLPLLHLFRKKPFEFSIIALFLCIYIVRFIPLTGIPLVGIFSVSCAMLFFVGIFAYELSKKINLKPIYYDIIALVTFIIIITTRPEAYNLHSFLNFYLIILFVCILKGATFFGILRLKGFIRLGKASYSIYIMHACVISSVFYFLYHKVDYFGKSFLDNSAYPYVIFLTILLICFIASLTYKFVELPFISLGRKIKFK